MDDFGDKLAKRILAVRELFPEGGAIAPFFVTHFFGLSDEQFNALLPYLHYQQPVAHTLDAMQKGQCYSNAFAVSDGGWNGELSYVEGVALRLIGMQHAWLCDAPDRALDPTWVEDGHSDGEQYLGFVFKKGGLAELISRGKMEYHGVFANPESFREVVANPSVYLEVRQ